MTFACDDDRMLIYWENLFIPRPLSPGFTLEILFRDDSRPRSFRYSLNTRVGGGVAQHRRCCVVFFRRESGRVVRTLGILSNRECSEVGIPFNSSGSVSYLGPQK